MIFTKLFKLIASLFALTSTSFGEQYRLAESRDNSRNAKVAKVGPGAVMAGVWGIATVITGVATGFELEDYERQVSIYNEGIDAINVYCMDNTQTTNYVKVEHGESYVFGFQAARLGTSHYWCNVELTIPENRKYVFPVYGGDAPSNSRNHFTFNNGDVNIVEGDTKTSFFEKVKYLKRYTLKFENKLTDEISVHCKNNAGKDGRSVVFSIQSNGRYTFSTKYEEFRKTTEEWECDFSKVKRNASEKPLLNFCFPMFNKGNAMNADTSVSFHSENINFKSGERHFTYNYDENDRAYKYAELNPFNVCTFLK